MVVCCCLFPDETACPEVHRHCPVHLSWTCHGQETSSLLVMTCCSTLLGQANSVEAGSSQARNRSHQKSLSHLTAHTSWRARVDVIQNISRQGTEINRPHHRPGSPESIVLGLRTRKETTSWVGTRRPRLRRPTLPLRRKPHLMMGLTYRSA